MALLHRAELRPTKLELLASWLPGRDWWSAGAAEIDRIAAYRFDDPAGEVGIETILVRAGDGPVFQAPLTYRGAPLDGADEWLIGTMQHSVLGPRWVYDACGDPVYAATLATAILTGGDQAVEYIEVDGKLERREPSMAVFADGGASGAAPAVSALCRVVGGDPTVIETDAVELAVVRRLGSDDGRRGARLTGTWPGQPSTVPLAYAVVE
jgi:hypothetical protein